MIPVITDMSSLFTTVVNKVKLLGVGIIKDLSSMPFSRAGNFRNNYSTIPKPLAITLATMAFNKAKTSCMRRLSIGSLMARPKL